MVSTENLLPLPFFMSVALVFFYFLFVTDFIDGYLIYQANLNGIWKGKIISSEVYTPSGEESFGENCAGMLSYL